MLGAQLERCSHPSAPLQLPLAPHAPAAAAGQVVGLVARGGLPLATFEHTPARPGSLQLWQPPAQVWSQHTPSAEQTRPVPQSLLAAHDSPAASLSPQRLFVLRQLRPLAQSVSDVQVLRQVGLLALHMYEPHEATTGAGQLPAPLQVAGKVWVPAAQLSWRQPVPLAHGRHAPEPLQVPSLEQSPLPAALRTQRALGSAPPLSTFEQAPAGRVRVPLQVLQSPALAASAHALSQHTPSVQKPLCHWLAAVQATPFILRPQLLPTQVLGATQSRASVAVVQLLRQAPPAQVKVPQD